MQVGGRPPRGDLPHLRGELEWTHKHCRFAFAVLVHGDYRMPHINTITGLFIYSGDNQIKESIIM